MRYQRIMIFGRPGSGKTTFATHLSKELGIPLYYLDIYFFLPDWQERPYEEFLALQQNLVAQEAWIIDGNALKSLEMRYVRADLIIYFSYSRFICYWRILKRFLKKRTINDRPAGRRKGMQWSLLRYTWNFDARVKDSIKHLQTQYPTVPFYTIRNNAELEKIMKIIFTQNMNN